MSCEPKAQDSPRPQGPMQPRSHARACMQRSSAASDSEHALRQSVSDGTSRRTRNVLQAAGEAQWAEATHSRPCPGLGGGQGPLASAGLALPSLLPAPPDARRLLQLHAGAFCPSPTPHGRSSGARKPWGKPRAGATCPWLRFPGIVDPQVPPYSGATAGFSEAERRMNTRGRVCVTIQRDLISGIDSRGYRGWGVCSLHCGQQAGGQGGPRVQGVEGRRPEDPLLLGELGLWL